MSRSIIKPGQGFVPTNPESIDAICSSDGARVALYLQGSRLKKENLFKYKVSYITFVCLFVVES